MCLFHYGQQLRQQRVEMWVSTKLIKKISAQEKTMALSSWLIPTLSPPNQRRSTRTSSASSASPWLSSSPSSYSTSSLSAKVIFRWKFENRSHSQSKLEVGPISEKNLHRKPHKWYFWLLLDMDILCPSKYIYSKGDPGGSEEMLGGAFVGIFCTYFHTVSFTLNLPLR